MNDDKKEEVVVETTTTEEKPQKEKKKKKSIIIRILDLLLWVVLLGWMAICFYDYYNVSNEKEPKFCLKEETTQYYDGTVDSCLGPGYKVYYYNRESYQGYQFGPFWIKDKTADLEEE